MKTLNHTILGNEWSPSEIIHIILCRWFNAASKSLTCAGKTNEMGEENVFDRNGVLVVVIMTGFEINGLQI